MRRFVLASWMLSACGAVVLAAKGPTPAVDAPARQVAPTESADVARALNQADRDASIGSALAAVGHGG